MANITSGFPEFLRIRKNVAELGAQPLVKAMGRSVESVIDATAGMGQDSYLLAVHGYSVIAFERCAEVARLLKQGLKDVESDPETLKLIKGSISFVEADSIEQLKTLEQAPDAVYLDPMYPPKRKKSALARKEIQFLRSLVGDDDDALILFETAMATARERVVVKRPHYAEPLAGKPTMSYQGKLVRFDVYKVN